MPIAMKRIFLALVLLASACAIPGDAAWSDLHANVYGGGIATTLSGSVGAPELFDDASVDDFTTFDGTLNLTDGDSTSALFGARFGFAPFELVVSQFNNSSNHSDVFIADLKDEAGDVVVFEESVDFTTSLDFDLQKMLVGLDLFNSPSFRIGLLAGVDLMSFNGFGITIDETISFEGEVLVSEGTNYSIATTEQLPIPMVGLRGDVLLPFTGVRAGLEVTGFSVDVEDIAVTYLDWDLNLNYAFNDWTEAMVGYRSVALDIDGKVEETNITADIEYAGPYFGVSFVF
jgi:hypothetical protein